MCVCVCCELHLCLCVAGLFFILFAWLVIVCVV